MNLYCRLIILLLIISSSVLTGCGPFLVANQQPERVGYLYIVHSAIIAPDSSLVDELTRAGFSVINDPLQADYTLFIGSVLNMISIILFDKKDNACLLDRIYIPVVGNPSINVAHDIRRAVTERPPISINHFAPKNHKCKI